MLDYGAIAEFLDSGVSMVGSSADDQFVPEAFRIWGAALDDVGVVRALVSSDARQTYEGVGKGTLVSMTFADPLNLRSMQVKGRSLGPAEAPGPDDVACMERYEATFVPKGVLNGTPPGLIEGVRPRSVFVLSIALDEAYDQTPGPAAGSPLEASS